ncbi:MAG: alpha-L-fucosidase [Bacteroidia bacterium]
MTNYFIDAYKKTFAFTLAICITTLLHAQTYQPTWESLDTRPVPQWYKDVKFGIFIHWGVYAVPGWCTKGNYSEWYQYGLNNGDTARIAFHKKKFGDLTYYQLADQFKAELFNPDEWAQVIEKSGAKYVVLTSKHHDGFANWPSKEASKTWGFAWNSVDAGPHRDLLGDLFKAIRKTSVHTGMYYSLYEWFNPLWLKDKPRYVAEHEWPQMKDLITTYRPDVFWTDGDWEASDSLWKSKEFLAWLYNESPVKDRVVTYDRWGYGIRFKHGGVYTPEYQPDVDFEDHCWEESRGMGFSYGYNREEDSWDYNSPRVLILNLIDKVSRGGNFLLDIGPDEHGKIPPIMEERLLAMGDWMKINNEAIYNTVRWRTSAQWSNGKTDYKPKSGSGNLLLKLTVDPDPGYAVKECFFTYNPTTNNLYALLPKWPSDKKFVLQDITLSSDTKIELIETKQVLSWQQKNKDVLITLPEFDPNKIKSDYAYVIKINDTGAFASKPKVEISYTKNSLKPFVSIDNIGLECRYTLDGSKPDENSKLYSKPFFVDSSCTLSARCFQKAVLPGKTVVAKLKVFSWLPATKISNVKPGLKYAAYELLNPDSVDDLKNINPVKTGVKNIISIGDSTRSENFGLEYEGYIRVPSDAVYTFYLSSDDGSKLWIDNDETIDNNGLHGDVERDGGIALKKGFHKIKVAYIQAGGDASLKLKYKVNEQDKKIVPASMFFHEE